MAKFLETVNLVTLSNPKERLYFTGGKEDGTILIVHEGNAVTMLEVSSQHQLKNWIVRHNQQFTGPAVYCESSATYLVTLNNKTLFRWEHDAEDFLSEGKKLEVVSPIHSLHSTADNQIVVLFSGGDVATLTNVLDDRKSPRPQRFTPDHVITDHCVNSTGTTILVACLTKNKKSKETAVHLSSVSGDQYASYLGKFTFPENQHILASTFIPSSNCIRLLTMTDDKIVHDMELRPEMFRGGGSLGRSVNPGPLGVTKNVHMTSVDDHHVIITGVRHHTLPGDSNGVGCVLFNLKYSLVAASCVLEAEKINKIWCRGGYLFVASEKNLTATQFRMEKMSLAAALGKHSTTVPENSIHGRLSWADSVPELRDTILLHANKPSTVLCGEVFRDLLKTRNIRGLCLALTVFDTVPEDLLVSTLGLFLSEDEATIREAMSVQPEIKGANGLHVGQFHIARAECINRVLAIRYDTDKLMVEIQKLPFHHAVLLLGYLHSVLIDIPLSKEKKDFSIKQVMEWLCVVLDSHYHQIMAAQDQGIYKVLKTISDAVTNMKSALEEISELRSLVNVFKSKQCLTSSRRPAYTVTRITIP